MKVGVFIIVYNLSSEIFLLQMAAIKKFCTDKDYEVIITDNSSNAEMAEDIRYHASILELTYIKTFSGGMGSDSHAFASNFIFQKYKEAFDVYFFLDHDCLPIKPFSCIEILSGGHAMAGIGQGAEKTYVWPGCVMWNAQVVERGLIDFSPSSIFHLDTGGNLYLVIDKYGKDSCIFFNEAYHENPYFHSTQYGHYATINNEMFLHCVNASNWNDKGRHQERINTLINIIKEKTGL